MRSVGGEIDDDLMKLARIDSHEWKSRRTLEVDLNRSRKGGADQAESFLDDRLHRNWFALGLGRTAKSENAANKIGGAGTGLGNLG